MKRLFLWGLPLAAVLVESTILSLPLTLCMLFVLYIVYRQSLLFAIAFSMGLLIDIFLLRTIGMSSMFFVVAIFIVFLYERKFETQTFPFVVFSSFLGSIIYMVVFGYGFLLSQGFLTALIAAGVFALVKKRTKRTYE